MCNPLCKEEGGVSSHRIHDVPCNAYPSYSSSCPHHYHNDPSSSCHHNGPFFSSCHRHYHDDSPFSSSCHHHYHDDSPSSSFSHHNHGPCFCSSFSHVIGENMHSYCRPKKTCTRT